MSPTRPPRACAFCGTTAPGNGRCPTCHATERRQSRQARGYTTAWTTYARRWRLRLPFCGQRDDGGFSPEHSACARAGRRRLAELVDHIQPVTAAGEFWDPANHQSLCKACHDLKTRVEQQQRPRWAR